MPPAAPPRHEDPRVLSVGVGWVPALRTFNATRGSHYRPFLASRNFPEVRQWAPPSQQKRFCVEATETFLVFPTPTSLRSKVETAFLSLNPHPRNRASCQSVAAHFSSK